MVTAVGLKRYVAGRLPGALIIIRTAFACLRVRKSRKRRAELKVLLGIVISELPYRQELSLVILLKVDKGSEINFNHSVLSLGLTVCLRMQHGW